MSASTLARDGDTGIGGIGHHRLHAARLAAMSDDELLCASGQGDEAAFSELASRIRGQVRSAVQQVLRDPARSEEVTQDVLAELWRTAPRFDPTAGHTGAWATTMARRRAIDRVRSVQARRRREQRDATKQVRRPYDDVVEQVRINEEHEELIVTMDRLTDLQREALQMSYLKDMTQKEIAAELGIPVGTVKTRVRDGLHRMRALLGAA